MPVSSSVGASAARKIVNPRRSFVSRAMAPPRVVPTREQHRFSYSAAVVTALRVTGRLPDTGWKTSAALVAVLLLTMQVAVMVLSAAIFLGGAISVLHRRTAQR